MVGGVAVRNRNGDVVMWFKGKDNGRSFALIRYKPDLADDEKMRRDLDFAFDQFKMFARQIGLPLFDASQLEAQLKLIFGENPKAAVGREFAVWLTDLTSGRRERLTIAAHSPEAG